MRPAAHSIARFAVWAALVAAGAVLATQGASAAALVMLASLFVAAVSWALVGPAVALVAVAALHALIAALPAPFAPELGLAPQAASMAAGWAAVALLHGLLGPRRGAIPHRLLLERIPGIVYVHDLRRDVPLFLSAAARARAGGTGAGAPAMHPDDLPRVREHLAQLDRSADDDARQIDYRMRDADGSFRWFRSTDAVLRRDRDGRAVEIVGVAAEIDELRQLRTQVDIERADRDLAAAAGIASWQWDPADGRVHWSAQQCALMRVDPQRFDGSLDALLQRLAPEHRAPFRDALQRARETGTLDVVACWQLDDGGRRWTRSIGRLTAAADSAPPRLRVIDVDVSAQHEARDELAQMQSQQQARLQQLQSERESLVAAETARREAAEQANRAKDEFLSLVSHELRTPLNAMVGWLHVLEQSGSFGPDAVARATTGLNRAVHQQRELVDTLLEAARAIRGELKLRKSPVDLNALVARCVEAEQPAAQQRRQGLVARLHAARPWIEADAERLERVLRTLLAAAIKYGSEGSQIRLAVESGAAMTVAVRIDERPAGAAASNLAQVFRAFDERQGGRLRAERQLALPFALAGQIVELHGGRIRLIDPGSGQPAALELALERVPPPPSETLAQDEPIDAIAFDGLSLLVVDDQSEMRDVLTTLLGQRGAHVTAVGSAREAMALYAVPKAGGRFDAAILDIAMPEEDGLSLLSRMREWEAQQQASGAEWPRLPALALTAHASSTLRDHALASGFDRFLAKPVAPVELFRTVAELIDRKPEPRARSPAGAGGSAPQPD